jgi:flagellin
MIDTEAVQLTDEIDRLARSTRYLGTGLLDGSGKDFEFQIGADKDDSSRLVYHPSNTDLRSSALGISGLNLEDSDSAQDALGVLDGAMQIVERARSELGGFQIRLQSAGNQLAESIDDLSAATARIQDADIGREASNLAAARIREQAGIAVLAQANQLPSLALKLLE